MFIPEKAMSAAIEAAQELRFQNSQGEEVYATPPRYAHIRTAIEAAAPHIVAQALRGIAEHPDRIRVTQKTEWGIIEETALTRETIIKLADELSRR